MTDLPADPTHDVDLRVRKRDRYSLELKFRHLIDQASGKHPLRRKTRVRVSFSLPYSFGIRPDTFDPERLYEDIKLYIRFNTPRFSVDELITPDASGSPITNMERVLRNERVGRHRGRFLYEAKLLGAIVKSLLRDAALDHVVLPPVPRQGHIDDFVTLARRLDSGLGRFRALLTDARVDPQTQRHLHRIDEHVSLTIETYLSRVLANREVAEAGLSLTGIEAEIIAQQQYRRSMGYPSIVRPDDPTHIRESYVHRQKSLKRFVSSVLFFEVQRKNQTRRVEHLLYAVAAGIAMTVATGISFVGQVRFDELSTPLFLLLVFGYMIKDRMKDAFRFAFQRTLGKAFFDRRTVFRDQNRHVPVGVLKERTMFVRGESQFAGEDRSAETPASDGSPKPRTRKSKQQKLTQSTSDWGHRASVLEYTKLLVVRERRLHRIHRRLTAIAATNVIDIKNLLTHLPHQHVSVPIVDGQNVTLKETHRVYYLTMTITTLSAGRRTRRHRRPPHLRKPRRRVVTLSVDAGGIRRITPLRELP